MLEFAKQLARGSGDLLMSRFHELRTIDTKQTATDLVTDADRASEAWIVEQIERRFPSHAILGEEGTRARPSLSQKGHIWVIDPLDGTVNYTHQLPIFAVSIGLVVDGALEVGVVYLPFLDEMFCAQAGKGATCNGKPLQVSSRDILQQSVLATGFPYDKHLSERDNVENFSTLVKKIRGIRRLGSASVDLAYVAAGRLDGYWEEKLKSWDIAAGLLLVIEAGGQVSNYAGKDYDLDAGEIIASNGIIHPELVELLFHSSVSDH